MYEDHPVSTAFAWAIGIGLACLAIFGIIMGGWATGWWFTNQNTDRQAHMIRNGYSNQQTLREQVTAKISDIFTLNTQIALADNSVIPALKAQRLAIGGILCEDANEVTGDPLPVSQQRFINDNCTAGAVTSGAKFQY